MKRSIGQHTLFAKLLLYFLIVLLVPILFMTLYFNAIANRTLEQSLVRQAEQSLSLIAEKMRASIETYRHLAYLLSVNPVIVNALSAEKEQASGLDEQPGIYEEMYSIMRGNIYNAAAHIISSSGKTQFSTHQFPSMYDIRYQRNAESPFNYWQEKGKDTISVIRTDRYINDRNNTIIVNIMRKVRDTNDEEIGYAVIDIFETTLSQLCGENSFSDIILINAEEFTGDSLLHNDRHGDFSQFPELTIIHPPYTGTYRGQSEIVTVFPVYDSYLFLAGVMNTGAYISNMKEILLVVVWIIAVGIIISVTLSAFLSTSISRPINSLAVSMRRVEAGDFTIRVPEKRKDEIGQLNRSFNTMVNQLDSLIKRTKEEERRRSEAERKALQSQINPHFLYNTLSVIKSIAKLHGEQEILTITVHLGKLLRGAIEGNEDFIPLKKSIEQAEGYLIIQQIRFGKKLHVVWDIDEDILEVKTPKLILQPLIENAIIHGLEPKVGDWLLKITGKAEGSQIKIQVSDNGVGFDSSSIDLGGEGEHIGMVNVYTRLKLYYGEEADLIVSSVSGEGSTVTILFPHPDPKAV